MKNLQRVTALVVVLLLTLSVKAFAMSQSDFIAYVSKAHTVNGITYQISSSQKKQLVDYLNDHPITEAQADEMKTKFDSLLSYAGSNGIRKASDATRSQKETLLAKANEIAAVIGVSVRFNSTNKTLEFYDKDGKMITAIGLELGNAEQFVQTGSSNYAYLAVPVALGVVALAGIVVFKKRA